MQNFDETWGRRTYTSTLYFGAGGVRYHTSSCHNISTATGLSQLALISKRVLLALQNVVEIACGGGSATYHVEATRARSAAETRPSGSSASCVFSQ